MAWTNPRTWATSEVVTAAMLNTHVRDNENWLHALHGCKVFKSGNQTVSASNNDVISWNSEVFDTDTMHDTVTNNSRLTVPSGLDGYWLFSLKVNWDADASNHGQISVRFRKNAAGSSGGGTLQDLATFTGHTNPNWATLNTVINLVATDYVEAFFNCDAAEARIITGAASSDSWFQAVYLGA